MPRQVPMLSSARAFWAVTGLGDTPPAHHTRLWPWCRRRPGQGTVGVSRPRELSPGQGRAAVAVAFHASGQHGLCISRGCCRPPGPSLCPPPSPHFRAWGFEFSELATGDLRALVGVGCLQQGWPVQS